MNNYFEREILAIERELSWVKTASQRSSGVIDTVSQTISFSIPLGMNTSQTLSQGVVYYEITPQDYSIFDITLECHAFWNCIHCSSPTDILEYKYMLTGQIIALMGLMI